MGTRRRFEDEDGGRWRGMLPRWEAPTAPPRLERRLRGEFQRRHRRDVVRLWAGRAAMLALAASAALMVRGGRGHHGADRGRTALTTAAVAELDLTGYEPIAQPRWQHAVPAKTVVSLDGFEPVPKMTLTRGMP